MCPAIVFDLTKTRPLRAVHKYFVAITFRRIRERLPGKLVKNSIILFLLCDRAIPSMRRPVAAAWRIGSDK